MDKDGRGLRADLWNVVRHQAEAVQNHIKSEINPYQNNQYHDWNQNLGNAQVNANTAFSQSAWHPHSRLQHEQELRNRRSWQSANEENSYESPYPSQPFVAQKFSIDQNGHRIISRRSIQESVDPPTDIETYRDRSTTNVNLSEISPARLAEELSYGDLTRTRLFFPCIQQTFHRQGPDAAVHMIQSINSQLRGMSSPFRFVLKPAPLGAVNADFIDSRTGQSRGCTYLR